MTKNTLMTSATPRTIDILTHAMDKISKASDSQEINTIIEKLLIDFTESDFATLLIFDHNKQLLYGGSEDNAIEVSMIDPDGLIGNCFLTKQSGIYNHVVSEKDYIPEFDNPDNDKLRSLMLIPIVEDDNLMGIIRSSRTIYNKKSYTNYDLSLLNALSPFLTKVIHILTSGQDLDYQVNMNDAEDLEIFEEETREESEIDSNLLFLSNAVHDIRTPANSLYGFLELIEEQIEDKRLKGFIENAKESAQFINALTDSILDRVRHTHEIQTAKPVVVNTTKFFAQNANIFSGNMFDKEIGYLVYIDPLLPKEIVIDEFKLKRVIINLIGNAYKFTPKGKQVSFKVAYDEKNRKLKIFVKDKGIGIDESKQKDIFEAFKQAEDDTSDQFGGTGLGLAICSRYVSELGGELKLKSELGKGSKFYFSIPVEIHDSTPSYEKFKNLNKNITILTDHTNNIDAKNIHKYIRELGMPSENITIADYMVSDDTTHLFCFQHKFSSDVLDVSTQKNVELTIVEEELFSLSSDPKFSDLNIMSINTYYGDVVHSSIFSGKKTKVLISDDNKINIMLLKSILETEYCDITSTSDGAETLEALKSACYENEPFDIIFLDKNMPLMSGTEVMREFKIFEQEVNAKPLFSISITGDPDTSPEEKSLYDLLINKPFKKQNVREAIKLATTK
ncbi:MAG: ATP-binding protein [Campylobacterota bacterium]|nr:ATP-binding protein [Campylobacterota bacterium]